MAKAAINLRQLHEAKQAEKQAGKPSKKKFSQLTSQEKDEILSQLAVRFGLVAKE